MRHDTMAHSHITNDDRDVGDAKLDHTGEWELVDLCRCHESDDDDDHCRDDRCRYNGACNSISDGVVDAGPAAAAQVANPVPTRILDFIQAAIDKTVAVGRTIAALDVPLAQLLTAAQHDVNNNDNDDKHDGGDDGHDKDDNDGRDKAREHQRKAAAIQLELDKARLVQATLESIDHMGSPHVQLPACSRNSKSPDDSFGTTTDPTVIILVAMSQPFRDALNEAAQQYLYASDGEVARVSIFDFEYKSPGKVIRGGDVRLAVMAMQ
ncbi:hypothetical protein UCRPA7_2634 [Phaeoacremonium minimum UCRPA7]|uniref:Uncharacterized protein n=1 Tax=Phaeoacremonium minimum (strain UCR-PA7) TaxID=1286976 RepID=R8BR28_PHAM7|nr:hypothetical protein UCRPA7_2634 [Phaeoacremonium minimum UCRPA7]EOO01828.1 hypothetical protein UCRPA7_2634 [Phaeoacremonium minimum UCRPA7]